ncbi:hypothetical protein CANINC_002553 [Pichia inconspicua]|uniref:P/Homo B domain-containing protein n=1 Tax=Pichia inconspicua TaxID=52247 RepID=A0A4T0X0Y7_9ASCO|nr:hypothetical protein CANINC_002553 [[Candida] inconspicua]
MKLSWLLNVLLALVAHFDTTASIPVKDHDAKDYFAIELKGNENVESLLGVHSSWNYEHPIDFLDGFHVFSLEKNHSDYDVFKSCESIEDLISSERKQLLKREHQELVKLLHEKNVRGVHMLPKKQLVRRAPVPVEPQPPKEDSNLAELNRIKEEFTINDPIFDQQWHLKNVAFLGEDVNVIPVWRKGVTGKGVVTALIDDGLDYESLDLKDNYCAKGSWDYNDNRPNPKPELSNDYHGTRCAAEIAAVKGNEYCGVGVAFGSKVSGIRILSKEITSEEESAAMVFGLDVNDIYSCSWGPPDNGRSMDAPDKLIRTAILKGVQEGRGGKGALYVFASGNGGAKGDTCNFDGYTNSIYSITVSAIDHRGLHPSYSEACTAVMVSTYSSGSGEHIHTTDIHDTCTDAHGGTSAAAPLAAGIYALVLEANPDLTWRDVQYLTVLSAGEIDPFHESWQESAIPGRRYSPVWGWGKTDAEKMVEMAQNNWQLLKPQSWYYMPYRAPGLEVNGDNGNEVVDTFEISEDVVKRANFERIEQLTVTVDISSGRRGDVEVELISPSGIKSLLARSRPRDEDTKGFRKWTFSSVAHWGESLPGTWTLKVRNTGENNNVRFEGWQMRAFGECINPELAKRFDINEDYSRINNEPSKVETTVTKTEVDNSETSEIEPPVTTSEEETQVTTTTSDIVSATSSEGASVTPTDGSKETPPEGSYPDSSTHHYLYYLVTLVIIGVAAVFYIVKNRARPGRARRREDFEFDIIRPDDDESSRFEFDDEFNEDQYDADYRELDDINEFDLGDQELVPDKATHKISDSIVLEHDDAEADEGDEEVDRLVK